MIQLFLPVKPSSFFFRKLDIVIIRNYCLGQTYVNSEILWAFVVHLQYFHFSLIFIQVLLCFCQMLRHNIFRNDINLHVDGRSQLELSIQALKACIEYQGLLLLCTRYRLWICIVLKAISLALPLEQYNLPCRINLTNRLCCPTQYCAFCKGIIWCQCRWFYCWICNYCQW